MSEPVDRAVKVQHCMGACCDTCRHSWDELTRQYQLPEGELHPMLMCRRYPPGFFPTVVKFTKLPDDEKGQPQAPLVIRDMFAQFPHVMRSWVCGEYQQRESGSRWSDSPHELPDGAPAAKP